MSHDVRDDMADDHVEPCHKCDYDMAENPDDPSQQWSIVEYCDACIAKYEGTQEQVIIGDGYMLTVCDVCNEIRCEIIDGVAPRYCAPCQKAGWK